MHIVFMSIINWALAMPRPPIHCFTIFSLLSTLLIFQLRFPGSINPYTLNCHLFHISWTALVKHSCRPVLWLLGQIFKFITSDIKLSFHRPAADCDSLVTSLWDIRLLSPPLNWKNFNITNSLLVTKSSD